MNLTENVVAIDPGKNGGIASCINGDVEAVKMPDSAVGIMEFLNKQREKAPDLIVFIERVQAFRGDTKTKGKRFGIDKMLANYNQILTVVEILGLPYIDVYPVSWQSYLKLKWRDKPDKPERKRRYRRYAEGAFPELKVTLATGDALCIVMFALRKLEREKFWILKKLKETK